MGLLSNFPWATLGRMEMPSEFWSKIEEQKTRSALFEARETFHLVVVAEVAGTQPFARGTWESLLTQSYPHWKALVAGTPEQRAQWSVPADPRFVWVDIAHGTSPSEAKNQAIARVEKGWVGVVGLGDVLSPAALFQLAWEIEKKPQAAGFYSQEVRLDAKQRPSDFVSKGFWNPWTLAHSNSIGRFWLARREALAPFELLPSGWDEQVELMRLACRSSFELVPYYYYYRRQKGIAAPEKKLWRSTIARVLKTQGLDCEVDEHITPSLAKEVNLVSAVICFRDRASMTCKAADSLLAARGVTPLEVILVDNDSSGEERAVVEAWAARSPVPTRLVGFSGAFNYGRMHNWAVREHCRGELLLLLNNDVELVDADLDYWAAWASQPQVATAGALLRFHHGGVQHSGVRAWFGGGARMVRLGNSHDGGESALGLREVFANTFAACMVKRTAFESVGGLREKDLVNGFGDVAFCFEAIRRGWKHLYLGAIEGIHAESSSRGAPYEYWEEFGLEREYPEILQRLLREDAGHNRVPGAEGSWREALMSVALVKFRKNSKWLNPIKPVLKKWLRNLPLARENA